MMSYEVCEVEQRIRDVLIQAYNIEPNDLDRLDKVINMFEGVKPTNLDYQQDLNDNLLRLYRMRRELTDPMMLEYKELIFAAYPDWEG